MIKNLVREHHWSPETIGNLYIDSIDYLGLLYYHDDLVKANEEIKKSFKK